MRINREEVPTVLNDCRVYSLDMATLLAGAKFRGDFEQRLKNVLKDLEKLDDDGHKAILFIDEMHTVMGAGATGGGSMDASNLLKPALSRGRLRCLGARLMRNIENSLRKTLHLIEDFRKLMLMSHLLRTLLRSFRAFRPKFEEHHGVKFSNPVLRAAVDPRHIFN